MKCLKCFNEDLKKPKAHKLPDMLSHLANYTICRACEDRLESARNNYMQHSDYYKKTQAAYRSNLRSQYINRVLADNSSLKPSDIPEELTVAKRQHLKMKRLLKENHGE